MKAQKYTIQQFNEEYPDNTACLQYLFDTMYGTAKCPKCKRVGQYHRQEETSHYVCSCGGHQISPKKGTIFQKSDTDLYKWFFAMFLFSASKNGVSAKEIERQVGVTYKTAWRMAHQIRHLMKTVTEKDSGTFEADETYIGGKSHGIVGRGANGKTAVFGLAKRNGNLKATAVPNVKRATIMPLIREQVKIGSVICTDEYHLYKHALPQFKHKTVKHGAKEYVRGATHTNTIEGFWSHVKASIKGTHRHVSKKHLQKYLDNFTWTWNHRDSSSPLFSSLLGAACA